MEGQVLGGKEQKQTLCSPKTRGQVWRRPRVFGGRRGQGTRHGQAPHCPLTQELCAAGPRAPRPTSRTPGLGAWGLFPPTGGSPEPSGLCLLGLRRHEPRVHGHGETGSGEPPQVERTPCLSTEAKEGEAAGPRSCPSPCACDPRPPVSRLVAVVTAPVSRALAPCPLRAPFVPRALRPPRNVLSGVLPPPQMSNGARADR